MSSGDTARQAPDVEGLLRAWLQTQECKERGLHLLRADDFQGVCDGHLVEALVKAGAVVDTISVELGGATPCVEIGAPPSTRHRPCDGFCSMA